MPAFSRDKSPRVTQVFAQVSSDSRTPKDLQEGAAVAATAVAGTAEDHSTTTTTTTTTATATTTSSSLSSSSTVKAKKSKKGFLPYFRGHRAARKEEKKEKEKKDTDEGNGKGEHPQLGGGESEAPPSQHTPPAVAPALSAPETGVEGVKPPARLSESEIESYASCGGDEGPLVGERSGKGGAVTRTVSQPPAAAAHKSPLHKLQTFQRSFLHNRFGSVANDVAAMSFHPQGTATLRPAPQQRPVAALRYHTLGPSSRLPQETDEEAWGESRSNTLDAVRARFYNHVNNLTYEGMDFPGDEASHVPSGLNLASKGCAALEQREKRATRDAAMESKNAVKKTMLQNLLQEDLVEEDGAGAPTTSVSGADVGITNSSQTVKAKLNITVVKTPEMSRRGRAGSLRGRTSQWRRKVAAGSTAVPAAVTITTTTTATTLSTATTTVTTFLAATTTTTATTTPMAQPTGAAAARVLLRDGAPIPDYAKVNKKKNSRPNLLREEMDEDDEDEGEIDGEDEAHPMVAFPPSHVHQSPAEKAPMVKRIESAGYKSRKDTEPTLKVNPVKRAESFKTGGRVVRRSSLSYTSRAKVLEGESFVKTQAVKLRRKDSKNGRLDPLKGARKAEYRVSVTIKPSSVAALTDKFNTIISQNQTVGPTDLPQVTLHKTRIPPLAPRVGTVHKTRQKFVRLDKEGAGVLTEKSRKEEKNREQRRGVAVGAAGEQAVLNLRRVNGKHGRSPNTRSPNSRSPNARSPNTRSPNTRSPNSRSPNTRSPTSRSPMSRSPTSRSPNTRSPTSRSPTSRSPTSRSPNTRSSTPKSPTARSPSARASHSRSPSPSSPPTPRPPSSSRSPPMRSARPRAGRARRGVARRRSSTGVGDNKTDEEKVCERIKTALSSSKFKGESEDEDNEGESTDEEKCQRDATREQSPTFTNIEGRPPSTLLLRAPNAAEESGSPTASVSHLVGRFSATLPERHAKSDSLDSGISADEYQLSPRLRFRSVPGHASPLSEDCSLDTVASSDTLRSEDSAVALRGAEEDPEDKDLHQEKDVSTCVNKEEEEEAEGKDGRILESEEKGMMDLLESESKDVTQSSAAVRPASSQEPKPSTSQSPDPPAEIPKGVPEGDEEEKQLEADSRSMESSGQDDATSEVSSVCSEAKSKKAVKVQESRIYTAVKSAVKNTVKKTKEKDAERKEERERRNRSPSADREKWYRRGRSRERKDKKKEGEEDKSEGGDEIEREREGRTYEKFTIKKLREKSQERKRNKEKAKEEEKRSTSEDSKKEGKNKNKEDKEEATYGKWNIRSRSRNRDRKKHKGKNPEQNAKEEARESEGGRGEFLNPLNASTSLQTLPGSSLTLPLSLRKSQETSVFTFDTESLYDTPQATFSLSMTLPPPPKTPIPSPPSSATLLLPPPPNTPIPDPPTESSGAGQEQKALRASAASDKGGGESDSSTEAENIYENLYAPDLEKLQRNRDKLEGRGIRPNCSFLWSEGTMQLPASMDVPNLQEVLTETDDGEEEEPERSPFTRQPGVRNYGRYGKIAFTGRGKEGIMHHNYAELTQRGGAEDTQTLAYDDIGAASVVSYDDVQAPSSSGYDDIRAPSIVGYDVIRTPSEGYDTVNPPRSDSSQYDDCEGGVVTAHFAVVLEDQLDSISYMYDEVSMYNASQSSHSYEPVGPPGEPALAVPCIQEVPEADRPAGNTHHGSKTSARIRGSSVGSEDGSEAGVHEVFSYKLTRIGASLELTPTTTTTTTHHPPSSPPTTHAPTTPTFASTSTSISSSSFAHASAPRSHGALLPPLLTLSGEGAEGAPSPSLSPTEGKSETSDEWVDLSDTETDTSTCSPVRITTQIPLLRVRQRSKRWRPRYWKRSWCQAAHVHGSGAHEEEEEEEGEEEEEVDFWREGGESDEEDAAGGHYEAIYEVISPAHEDDCYGRQDDPDFDDSFDSDDSDDAYCRLRPPFPDDDSQLSREHHDSLRSDESAAGKQDENVAQQQQQQQQQHGITKIAEAANLGMRRLRRNWSHTKNEVRTGLNRIKKKSTFSASDIKSTENLASDLSPSNEEKRKWSFKSHFRRKSSTGSMSTLVSGAPPLPPKKDSATFYLTLTIEAGAQDAGELSDASQPTVRSDAESVASGVSARDHRRSNTPSIASVTTLASADGVPTRRSAPVAYSRKNSTGSNSGGPVRPRTAPPAPPPKVTERSSEKACRGGDGETEELSKTEVASRLNHLLSCGPTVPPGRRVLRTSDDSSSDASPVPVLVHPDDAGYPGLRLSSVKYATIDPAASSVPGDSSGDERVFGAEAMGGMGLNLPRTRTSVASSGSHGSSEGYIRLGDIASAPPPLPARRNPIPPPPKPSRPHSTGLLHLPSGLLDGDNNSYLDFSVNALIQDEPLYVSSHFADEPLYQFYTAGVLERAAHNQGDCSSEDDYEVINDGQGGGGGKLQSRPSAMELVTPVDGRRTLWCELPEVMNSGLLSQISGQERKIQEAMFEMITSEASYLRSLNVLVTHFVQCRDFIDEGEDAVLSRRERHILFSDILPVKRCSELFLADLEKRWQESVKISNIADIICKHANNHFQVYVKYCSNQVYQDRTLKELKENNPRFLEVLNMLESSPVCQSLAMHSFLMLPMQRITRLPLLVDAIFHRLEHNTPVWHEYKVALATLTKIVAECNEGARRMERMEEMLILSRQLDFREVKAIPLLSASRWLVKKGELTRLTWRENDGKLTFGKRISKCTLYFFLFTDLLVVTKKKSEDQYMVLDYCSRNMVQVLELDTADKFPGRILDGHKNLLIMTMLQNHENKTVEMIVSCPMESDRTRWVEAVTPRSSDNPDERIYEEWDCPQVQAIHPYVGKQADELSLEASDVVNVLKKMSDGWYHGERIRDQERGWFPGRFTVEISSTHVRARNLRQRYRLLAISGSILDELKKEKERYEKEERKKDRRRTLTIMEVISSQGQPIS